MDVLFDLFVAAPPLISVSGPQDAGDGMGPTSCDVGALVAASLRVTAFRPVLGPLLATPGRAVPAGDVVLFTVRGAFFSRRVAHYCRLLVDPPLPAAPQDARVAALHLQGLSMPVRAVLVNETSLACHVQTPQLPDAGFGTQDLATQTLRARLLICSGRGSCADASRPEALVAAEVTVFARPRLDHALSNTMFLEAAPREQELVLSWELAQSGLFPVSLLPCELLSTTAATDPIPCEQPRYGENTAVSQQRPGYIARLVCRVAPRMARDRMELVGPQTLRCAGAASGFRPLLPTVLPLLAVPVPEVLFQSVADLHLPSDALLRSDWAGRRRSLAQDPLLNQGGLNKVLVVLPGGP